MPFPVRSFGKVPNYRMSTTMIGSISTDRRKSFQAETRTKEKVYNVSDAPD